MIIENYLADWIKDEEGFREKPYLCSEGIPTIGYGFTYITRSEADRILKDRLAQLYEQVIDWLDEEKICLDVFRTYVLCDMVYQLGFAGVKRFKKFIAALRDMDYDTASKEMLNSRWYVQTPLRCELLAERMKNGFC